ncbi:MAG: tRNA (guanine-N7-)-methyltransferase [Candidatus Midichloriaceae bacterium]|jgi:tRNA (guanine-N7-)-methyltransferase
MLDLSYIPYKSRRNIKINNKELLDLLNLHSTEAFFKSNPKLNDQKINLEIGFGSGEFILQQAKQNPEEIFFGCEVYNHGVIKLLHNIQRNNLKNIFVCNIDVREFLLNLPKEILFNNIYIYYPDPWPKKKHNKRRLISGNFLEFLLNKFQKNLCITTDHKDYAESILYQALLLPSYYIDTMLISNNQKLHTKFEKKAIMNKSNIFNFILKHSNESR